VLAVYRAGKKDSRRLDRLYVSTIIMCTIANTIAGTKGSQPGHSGAIVLRRGDIGGPGGASSYSPRVIDADYSLSSPKTVCA
jgi:hypothetical protein